MNQLSLNCNNCGKNLHSHIIFYDGKIKCPECKSLNSWKDLGYQFISYKDKCLTIKKIQEPQTIKLDFRIS